MTPESMIERLEKAKARAQEYDLESILITIPFLDMIVELLKREDEKRKTGHWIDLWDVKNGVSEYGSCSVCERISQRPLGRFCRWCGAEMSEE